MRNVLHEFKMSEIDIVNKRFTVFFEYNNIFDIIVIRELTRYSLMYRIININ